MMAVFYVNGTVLFLVWKLFHFVAPDSRATIFPSASLLYFSCCMFFFFFLTSLSIRYIALCIPKQPPNVTSFHSNISYCTQIPHTQQKHSTNVILLFFIFFDSKNLQLIPWALGNRNHFTFFPHSFSLFFHSFTVFYYLNGASFSVHKTTNFFLVSVIVVYGKKWRVADKETLFFSV